VSRGAGRLMVAILGALRNASEPLAFGEIATGIYGSRIVTRSWRGRLRRVVVPAGDTANLRRALCGLVRRGDIVVVGDDALPESARRPHGTRYAVSDRCTGNEGRPANDLITSTLPPEPTIPRGLPANDVALELRGAPASAASRHDAPEVAPQEPPVHHASRARTPVASSEPPRRRPALPALPPGSTHRARPPNEANRTAARQSLTPAERRFLDFLARTALRVAAEEAKLAAGSDHKNLSTET
jgi:hypothetical protein